MTSNCLDNNDLDLLNNSGIEEVRYDIHNPDDYYKLILLGYHCLGPLADMENSDLTMKRNCFGLYKGGQKDE